MVTPWRVAHMLASKLASLPGFASCQICRHASRDAYVRTSQRRSDSHPKEKQYEDLFKEDQDTDVVEAELDSIFSEERRKHNAAKFHMLKRKMNKPGAPERRLSWDAIKQIRYLKQESPDEWTLQRLAEAFSVNTDVISRVLRSKFTPTAQRKLQQDSKVFTGISQLSLKDGQAEQSRLSLTNTAAAGMLSPGNTGALATQSSKALALKGEETGLLPSGGNVPSVSRATIRLSNEEKMKANVQEQPNDVQKILEMNVGDEEELEEEWDGVILTEEELEQIAQTLQEKLSPVVQKGREFFDCDGNFLYRI